MQENDQYSEWLEKINKAAGVAEKAVVSEVIHEERVIQRTISNSKFWKKFLILLVIFLAALLPRLYFIFFASAPENAGVGWYGDTYHHWQIGYLTWKVGLSHGFLRLWDLKGMEFFWGLFHPLLLTIWFSLTGIINIAVTRVMSAIFGSLSIILLYVLGKRYFGTKVGWTTALFGVVFPIAIFNDATGSLEPFGVFFLLLGVYLFEKNALWAGFAWVLASMVRAEAWLFSFGLLLGVLFLPGKQYRGKKLALWVGWSIPMLFYIKYILSYTGNPIYPIYWNFLANGLGVWVDVQRTLTPLQLVVRPILQVLGVVSAIALLIVVVKRPRSMLLLLLGFGNIFFVTAFMGFGHYIAGWEWWFPVIRFFVFPYLFIVLLVFALLAKIPHKKISLALLFSVCIVLCILTQWTWQPIMQRFSETIPEWQRSVAWGREVGKVYTKGSILFPEGDPHFTYTTVVYGNLSGERIVGEMFDPFYYIGEETAFTHWDIYKKRIYSWLRDNNINLAVFRDDAKRYNKLVRKEPTLFEKIENLPDSPYAIYRVYPERIKLQ